uniref:Uncharacterized protein n=1 Tax=Amphimedon queenslandica TaxID=400682 RepID=A0A1X7UFN7_AMPQE
MFVSIAIVLGATVWHLMRVHELASLPSSQLDELQMNTSTTKEVKSHIYSVMKSKGDETKALETI